MSRIPFLEIIRREGLSLRLLPVASLLLFINITHGQGQQATRSTPVGDEAFSMIAQFFDYDRMVSLRAKTVGRTETDMYVREKIVFDGLPGNRVIGYIAFPKNEMAPFPLIILVDGIGGTKDRWFARDNWPRGLELTTGLLSAGFAVFALDAAYHGERSAEHDFESPMDVINYPNWYRRLLVQTTVEYRRGLDYLFTRQEVDTSRVGVLGLSMGGMIAFYLSALDGRVKASVAGLTPPFRATSALFVKNFARRIHRPFLMLMGRTDGYYTESQAEQLFSDIPAVSKELVFYDVGHRLPPEYVPRAVWWFLKHLRQ